MAHTAVTASPLGCRWIQRGSEMSLSPWTYALCLRAREPRVVSETECAHCPWWEEPQDREVRGKPRRVVLREPSVS
jgi:hypothetical protein